MNMTKVRLKEAQAAAKAAATEAIQTIVDCLNQGQRKKLAKNEKVRKVFDLYGIPYE